MKCKPADNVKVYKIVLIQYYFWTEADLWLAIHFSHGLLELAH